LTHYLSENICAHFNKNTLTNVITIRLSNSYGDPVFSENNCWWLAINDLCKSAFMNKEIRLLSDGSPQRDFIHGNDVCHAIDILNNTDEKLTDNVYHICSGNTLTLLEIAQAIKKEYQLRYGISLPIITAKGVLNNIESDSSSENYTISNNKLKKLGFLPAFSITRGIGELFSYMENNFNNFS
jgi:UDP-glucose 4-epimerase